MSNKGYGSFCITLPTESGRGEKIKLPAHRMSLLLSGQDVPVGENMCVMHQCDNPKCVNPFHLTPGTMLENTQDKVNKGRCNSPKGEKAGTAKLTDDQVVEMRTLYAGGNYTHKQLAKKYNVTYGMVGFIVRGEAWQHVGGPIVRHGKRGEIKTQYSAKITKSDAEKIRDEHRTLGLTPKQLAEKWNLSYSNMCLILTNKIWNW